jgi:hypothetical protein
MYTGVMRRVICSAVLGATLFATSAHSQTKRYKIYCVSGKVEISTKELTEMRAARGAQVCLLEAFDSFSEASQAAKRHGGVGGNCACK